MAERTIVVCDVCGEPATETVTIKTARGNFVKDLCAKHVAELTSGARKPRPGRPRKMGEGAAAAPAAPRRRGRPRKTAAANGRRKSSGRKTTRRRKAQASSTG